MPGGSTATSSMVLPLMVSRGRSAANLQTKVVDSERYKQLNLVQKCVATAAAICGYVKSRAAADDLSTEELWAIFCVAWGVSGVEVPPSLSLTNRADAATKRLGICVSKTSHLLLPFPNAWECVQVNASRLTRYLDCISTPMDLYALIDCTRSLGL